ncbi:hypothetical protein KXV85_005551, partial [Aspergillus fumigatus]
EKPRPWSQCLIRWIADSPCEPSHISRAFYGRSERRGAKAAAPSQQLGTYEQRSQRVGRLHGQHAVGGGTLQRQQGLLMQRAEFHPLDRIEAGDEAEGLPDRADRNGLAVELDAERRPERRFRRRHIAQQRG